MPNQRTPLIKKQDESGNGSRFRSAAVLVAFFAKLADGAKDKINLLSQLITSRSVAKPTKMSMSEKSRSQEELFGQRASGTPVEEKKHWYNFGRAGYKKV